MSNPQVGNNTEKNRFELAVDGSMVVAEYNLLPGAIAFTHTLTPSALRGRGLAGQVVKAGLDHARAQNLKVIPQCWYVAEYIGQHPEYQSLVER
ncbi:MAG: N-acetyltransferase [Hyphomicrobiales bacterium]|nr:MAG: N-acetyltransferase [Hyphomicrobiales bacterium]